jgi:hypothetical protein
MRSARAAVTSWTAMRSRRLPGRAKAKAGYARSTVAEAIKALEAAAILSWVNELNLKK